MKKTTLSVVIAAVSMGASQVVVADDFKEALTGGDVNFDFRYRYENVDDDLFAEDAHASTLRSRLTYTTKTWNDFQAQIEVDDVNQIGNQNHNDLQDADFADHALVLDPEGNEVNQAWVAYTGISDTTVKVGRQRVNFDNQRHIGSESWRQNEMTHDAVVVANTSLADTTVVYAYVTDVQTITGDAEDTDTQLLNVNYSGLASLGTLSAYWYDIEDVTETAGVRFVGSQDMDSWSLLYEAEWATQSDNVDGVDAEADYTHFVLGANVAGVTVKVGQETMESDDGSVAFQFLLGSNHEFNGWADRSMGVVPDDGLEDTYIKASATVMGLDVAVAYHEFEADEGSVGDYGDEIDISIAKQVADNVSVLLKYADYSDDTGSDEDVQKLWLQVQVAF
jgi:hypothetical protein